MRIPRRDSTLTQLCAHLSAGSGGYAAVYRRLLSLGPSSQRHDIPVDRGGASPSHAPVQHLCFRASSVEAHLSGLRPAAAAAHGERRPLTEEAAAIV